MAAKPRFTRIMKVQDLAYAGVPTEAIPTYCALGLRQQQEWSVLAQDGDPGQDPRPLRAHRPEAPPFT